MLDRDTPVTVPLNDHCDTYWVDELAVARAGEQLISTEDAGRLAEIFAALADATRLRLLDALRHAELCVCDLSALLQLSQSATSHHLRLLRHLRIVRCRRDGKRVYYALDDHHVRHLLGEGLRHVEEAR
ncbi:MAG: helix-turn-helix transcriptional regulator [Chloroflexi bacterium]|nr:helix-turn-helix transcriptional regulator [Chloroflexota bacterium]